MCIRDRLLAARAWLDMHRYTIAVLHMLGSTDRQVARLFQRRIALDTLLGGLVGTLAAMAAVWLLGRQAGALGSELLSGVALAQADWLMLAGIPVLFALLAMIAARSGVLRSLVRPLRSGESSPCCCSSGSRRSNSVLLSSTSTWPAAPANWGWSR